MNANGVLYLCATPIGNLEDITLRALRILKEVDLVAAEDTRHTRKLFSHYDIHTPLTSYHDHNRRSKGHYLIGQLLEGKNIALVTDAGLPGVSDPGEDLASMAVGEGIKVVPVPGPSASLTALVASGLPASRFCFEGFLPARGKERSARLLDLKREMRTMVFYEAPHRLKATLSDLLKVFGDRRVCVARELTKFYEEIWRGSLREAAERFALHPPKGEITLVLEGAGTQEEAGDAGPGGNCRTAQELASMVQDFEQKGLTRKEAIKEASVKAGIPKREVYSALLDQKKTGGE
ncbi:MAG: 16S rRNA (cytidine(1402)-2'-O)-methyltransferase [Bacillota bacterium]